MKFLKRALHWFKEHPLVLALVVGVVILILLLRGSSSGSSTASASGPSDAAVNANAQLAGAQIAAGVQEYQTSAQLTAAQDTNATNIAIATLAAQTQQYTTAQNAAVSLSGIQAQENVQLAGIASQTQLADIAAQTTQTQINGTVAIAEANAHTYEAITNAQAETQQHAIDAAAAVQLAPYQYEASVAQSIYSNLGSSGLQAVLKNATSIKDAILNLPGISAMRATNYIPPGASAPAPGQGGAIASGIGSALQGIGSIASLFFA